MVELELGNNLVVIISLIVNAILVPLIAAKHQECKKLKKGIDKIE